MLTPKAGLRTENRMNGIYCCVIGQTYWKLLSENAIINAISDRTQLERLSAKSLSKKIVK